MRSPLVPQVWVGRDRELTALHRSVDALAAGQGSVVWVEGEPGIGKSSLVAAGLATAGDSGCEVLWGAADQFTQRFPLGVMLACLDVQPRSPDARRAEISALLGGGRQPVVLAGRDDDVVPVVTERLLALVDELCIAAPTALVVDDMQWADEASITLWHRLALAVDQLPLLLVGACRAVPRRREIEDLRAWVAGGHGDVIVLDPLAEADVDRLVAGLTGVPPDQVLRRLAGQAAGNPLYVGEIVDALEREQAWPGDAGPSWPRYGPVPASLTEAITGRLG